MITYISHPSQQTFIFWHEPIFIYTTLEPCFAVKELFKKNANKNS